MKQIDVKGTLENLVLFVLIVFSVYAAVVIHNNYQEFKEYQYQDYERARVEYLTVDFGSVVAEAKTTREVDLVTYYKVYVTYPLSKLSQQIKGSDTAKNATSAEDENSSNENSSSDGYTTLIGDIIDALKE